MNLVVACGLYTTEHCISTRQAAFSSNFTYDCFCAFALCKALADEMRLLRRVRALAFSELWGLALTGALGPVVSGEYLNEHTIRLPNAVLITA